MVSRLRKLISNLSTLSDLGNFQKGFLKITKSALISYLIIFFAFSSVTGLFLFNPFGTKEASAVWFNDNWYYRQEVPITANAAADTNAFFSFTLDTATLITAGKLQSSCQDIRVTDVNGKILDYHVGRTNACNLSNTTIDALPPPAPGGTTITLPAGASTYYVYYGNPAAISADAGAFTQSEAASYTVGTLGSEVKAPPPTAYWKFDEGQGTTANSSTSNNSSAISFIQSKSAQTAAAGPSQSESTVAVSFDTTPKAGNLVVVATSCFNVSPSATGVTDNQGNTYTQITVEFNGSNVGLATYYAKNIAASGTFTVTFNCDGGTGLDDMAIAVHEYAGADRVAPLDQSTDATGFTTTPDSGNITTTTNGELYFGAMAEFADFTMGPGATYTQREELEDNTDTQGIITEDKITTAGTYSADFTVSTIDTWNAAIVSFKPASGSGLVSDSTNWRTENFCVSGKCLYFDGANNDNVSTPDTALLDFAAADNFTVSAWVKRNGASSANNFILTKAQSGYTGYKLYQDASGDYCFDVRDGTNTDTACTSAVEFDDDAWHFVTGVKAGTTSITLYVDGKQRAQDASIAATGTLANTGTFYTGVDLDGTSNEWLGFIDEVKVFRDQSARTAAQVLADYNARSNPEGVSQQQGNNITNLPGALSQGLVGYWKADESSGDAADSSGNAATLTNTATTTYTASKFANGAEMNGTTQYLSRADTAPLSVTGSLTLAAWIEPDDVTGSEDIIAKWDGANESYLLAKEAGEVRMYIDSSSNYQATTGTPLAANTKAHVVGVYDVASATVKIYVNGTEAASSTTGTIPSSIGDDAGKFHLGAEDSTTTAANFFDGHIDEARVYNRALSGAEVSQLYNWAPGPLGYWKMDEKSGTSAIDSSANAKTLTLSAASWSRGKYGGAWNGTGSVWMVDDADDADLDIAASDVVSISLWFKSDSATNPSNNEYLVTKGTITNTGTAGYTIYANSSGNIVFGIKDDGAWGASSPNTTTPDDTATSTADIYDGTWHHIVAVKAGTSSIYIYVDGVSNASDTSIAATGSLDNSIVLRLGDDDADSANSFNGDLDDVKIYRYSRTGSQVVEDMNAGHPAPGSPVGSAVAYYKFDEGGGAAAGNSNPGSVGNITGGCWTKNGKFNGASNGDGNCNFSMSADDNDLDFVAADDLAFSFWFKSDSTTNPTNAEYLLTKATVTNTGTAGYAIYTDSTGKISFGIRDDGTWGASSPNTPSPEDVATSTADLYDNTWHYLVAMKTGTSRIDLYVDGRLNASDTSLTASGNLSNDIVFIIGNDDGLAANSVIGDIDEFKVFRNTLTLDQIKLDMNRASTQVLGALGTNSSFAGNSASQEYCIPGDSATCTAPIGEWRFEERTGTTAYDTSGNTKTGTLSTNGTSNPTWTTGKVGAGLYFNGDGASDTSKPLVSVTDFAPPSAVTFCAWIYPQNIVDGDDYTILNKDNSEYDFRLIDTAGVINLNFNGVGDTSLDYSLTANQNKWYHVCATQTGTSGIIYRNGVQTASGTAGAITDTANALWIGRHSQFDFASFDGKIDNVRMYGYVRSAAQIAYEYNRGLPVAHWKMDECQGTTINDSSGNSVTGTLTIGGTGGNTAPGTCSTSGAWFDGVSGKRNYSMDFDDTDDYISTSANSALNITADITLSAWIKRGGTSNYGGIIAKTDGAGTAFNYDLGICSTSAGCTGGGANVDKFFFYSNATTPAQVFSTSAITDTSNWYHIVLTRSGSTYNFYINGRLDSTGSMSGAFANNSYGVYIGTDEIFSTSYFNGGIDDARIYNYALTATQVKSLYNEGATRYGPTTGAP